MALGSGAVAVDAAMASTQAADQQELLFESLTCAMDTDGGVARGDASLFREGFKGVISQVYFAKDLVVGGFEGRENLLDTLADDLLCTKVIYELAKIASPMLKSTIFDGTVTIVVDDSISENAVKPGGCRFFLAQRGSVLDRTSVGALKNIFSCRGRIDTSLYKAEKLLPMED